MKDGLGVCGRVVLLGGTSELGVALVERMVSDGTSSVVLAGRSPGALAAVANRLGDNGAPHVTIVDLDVDRPGAAEGLVEALRSSGDVDCVIFAVGELLAEDGSVDDPTPTRMATTNFSDAVPLLAGVAGLLETQGHGTLVVFSSVAGQRARADNPVYAASKAGLDVFCRGLGLRLKGTGVDVVVVRPGFVHTRMTNGLPVAPFATTADKVAADVVDGIRRGRAVVWSPPVLRYVFGVLRSLPDPLWIRLGASRR